MGFLGKSPAMISHKENAHPVIAFLICNSSSSSGYDFICHIKQNKCHQGTFLPFLHINLMNLRKQIHIKYSYPVGGAVHVNPHLCQFIQAFLNISGTANQRLNGFGADHEGILMVVLRGFGQRF